MLTMLEITPEKNRPLPARIFRSIFRPPLGACLKTVVGRPYIHISCERTRRPLDWRLIAAYNLEGAGRLVLPKGVEPPKATGLRRFRPTRFRRRMLEHLATDILVCSDTAPAKRSIALYGREAEIKELLPRLIPMVGEIRIITRRAYALDTYVRRLEQETGMAIAVTSEMDASCCSMLLAPSGGSSLISVADKAMVLSPDIPMNGKAYHVRSGVPVLPPFLEELYDDSYDITELVGAFYELAAMRELGDVPPRCGMMDGKEISVEKFAELYTAQIK